MRKFRPGVASASTRSSTPTVSGRPQTGHDVPLRFRVRRQIAHVAGAVAGRVVLALLRVVFHRVGNAFFFESRGEAVKRQWPLKRGRFTP